MAFYQLLVVSLLGLSAFSEGAGCTGASFDAQTYSTPEVVSSNIPQYSIVFSVKCASGSTGPNLYAKVGENIHQVSRSTEGKTFQVSWAGAANQLGGGTQTVSIYDEEGYQGLKKSERSGSDGADVKALGTIDLTHQAVWKGPWVSSEALACLAVVAACYFAYTKKSQILS